MLCNACSFVATTLFTLELVKLVFARGTIWTG